MRYQGKYSNGKPPRKRRNNRIWLSSLCVLLAAMVIVTGAVFAKYKQSVALKPVNLTVSSGHLAATFTLQEHLAVRQSNGIYTLHGTKTVASNTYSVTPGVAIPKNPHFTLTGKSKLPAYLYVEIIDGLGTSGLAYTVNNNWLDLNLTGKNGGKVYVYTGGGTTGKLLDETFNVSPIYILENNQVTVSNANTSYQNVTLTFHGYLAQASLANTPKEVYEHCFGGGNKT